MNTKFRYLKAFVKLFYMNKNNLLIKHGSFYTLIV